MVRPGSGGIVRNRLEIWQQRQAEEPAAAVGRDPGVQRSWNDRPHSSGRSSRRHRYRNHLGRRLLDRRNVATDSPRIGRRRSDRLRVFLHDLNQGKGAALRHRLRGRHGPIRGRPRCGLEYDPNDFHQLLQPLLARSRPMSCTAHASATVGKVVRHSVGTRLAIEFSRGFPTRVRS